MNRAMENMPAFYYHAKLKIVLSKGFLTKMLYVIKARVFVFHQQVFGNFFFVNEVFL